MRFGLLHWIIFLIHTTKIPIIHFQENLIHILLAQCLWAHIVSYGPLSIQAIQPPCFYYFLLTCYVIWVFDPLCNFYQFHYWTYYVWFLDLNLRPLLNSAFRDKLSSTGHRLLVILQSAWLTSSYFLKLNQSAYEVYKFLTI